MDSKEKIILQMLPSTSANDASFLGTTIYNTRPSDLFPTIQKLVDERVYTSVNCGYLINI